MAAFRVALDDSSPLISYSPSNAWIDTPAGDSFASSYALASLHTTNVSGASAEFTFNGTGVWLFGGRRPHYGAYYVSIDDHIVSAANASSSEPAVGQVLGGASNLSMGQHTVALVSTENGMIDFDSLIFETEVGSSGQSVANVTLDDTSANFTYGPPDLSWTVESSPVWYNSSFHVSSGGAQASLSFMGDAVAIYGAVAPELANYTITLDGQVSQSFGAASVSKLHTQTLLYFANNLGPSQHSLVLTGSEVHNTSVFTGIDFATVYTAVGSGNLVMNSNAGLNGAVPPITGSGSSSSASVSASAIVSASGSFSSTASSASSSGSASASVSSASQSSIVSASSTGSPSSSAAPSQSQSTNASASSASQLSIVPTSSTASPSSSAPSSASTVLTFSSSSAVPTSSSSSVAPSQSSSSSPGTPFTLSSSSSAPASTTSGMPNTNVDKANAGNNNSNASAPGATHSSNLSLPAIIGIAIGSFVALALLLALLACLLKHRRTQVRKHKELPSPVLPIQDPDLEAGYGVGFGADGLAEKQFVSKRATAATATTRWSQASFESDATLAQSKWLTAEPVPVRPLNVANRSERESAHSESSQGSTFVDVPMETAALYPAWGEGKPLTPGMFVPPGTGPPSVSMPPRPARPPTMELGWRY